ncbi:MAG: flagellar biosynthetic protein FliO [Pyrinomonadaceae bacterium]
MSESDRLPFMQDDRAQVSSSSEASSGPFGLLARTLGALLLIVGLIFGAGWGLKRYGGPRFGATQQQLDMPALSVISTASLGERRSLAVVKFGERTLLLGSTQQTITLIAEEQNEDGAVPPLPVRRVADMLNQSHTDDSFEHQLSGAEERLEIVPGSWHAPEREGTA